MQKSPEFDATYDPVVRKSKCMQKRPEFDATCDPKVNKSKGMQTRFKKILDRQFYNFKHFLNLINILYFIGAQCL